MLGVLVLSSVFAFEQPRLVPQPVEAKYELKQCVELSADLPVTLTVASEGERAASKEWFARHVREAFGVTLKKVETPAAKSERTYEPEAYALTLAPEGIRVEAAGLAGVRYAFQTLRQMAMPKRGTLKVAGWIAPGCQITDKPKMKFRGIHLCWLPETSNKLIERGIRLAGYYKLNFVVIETWGTFRSEKYPWFGWKGEMTKAEIRRLKAIAEDLGITLVPQINIFGHATMSRRSGAKHAVLDLSPEYQPLYEPHGGWNWCLTNPEALKVMDEVVTELHEAFGNPPYFHIGCDEADPPSCPTCRSVDYVACVASNITRVATLLEKRGARALMWHDMLLKSGKWHPFWSNAKHGEEKMLGTLPKSIVICDWYYQEVVKNGYPTFKHFRDAGYDVLTVPWENAAGTMAQAKAAAEAGALGILGTTWHHLYKLTIERQFVPCAAGGWGTKPDTYGFADHWRQMGWDTKVDHYDDCGVITEQIPRRTNNEIVPGF